MADTQEIWYSSEYRRLNVKYLGQTNPLVDLLGYFVTNIIYIYYTEDKTNLIKPNICFILIWIKF